MLLHVNVRGCVCLLMEIQDRFDFLSAAVTFDFFARNLL